MDEITFGEVIRSIRKAKGMTQEEVAEAEEWQRIRASKARPQLDVSRPLMPYMAPIKAVPFFRKSVIRSVEDAEEFLTTCASIVAK